MEKLGLLVHERRVLIDLGVSYSILSTTLPEQNLWIARYKDRNSYEI